MKINFMAIYLIANLVGILLISTAHASISYNFTTFNVPGADSTMVTGISGSNIVGTYKDDSIYHGFLYNGTSFTTIDVPNSINTYVMGVSGDKVLCTLSSGSQFIYNNGTFSNALTVPGASYSRVTGMSGNNVTGFVRFGEEWIVHGFIFDGTNYTSFDAPNVDNWGAGTIPHGIFGNKVVGRYSYTENGMSWDRGFIYDGKDFTSIDVPGAYKDTIVYGIWDNIICGDYTTNNFVFDGSGNHGIYYGFIYDGVNYTTIEVPGAYGTTIVGIWGGTLIGTYSDASGEHSFVATPTPIPPAILLMGSGLIGLIGIRRKKKTVIVK